MLKKQVRFTTNLAYKIRVAFITAITVVLILYFFKPFDLGNTISDSRTYLYFGYGIAILLVHLATIFIETKVYENQEQDWYAYNQILSELAYFFVVGLFIYIYHFSFIEPNITNPIGYFSFLFKYVFPFFVVWTIVLYAIRMIKGTKGEASTQVKFYSNSKKEKISLLKSEVLYGSYNKGFVTIYFNEGDQVKSFKVRNSLSNVLNQAPFMVKCHASFIVNPEKIQILDEFDNKTYLALFGINDPIPVSKSFYRLIKKLSQQA